MDMFLSLHLQLDICFHLFVSLMSIVSLPFRYMPLMSKDSFSSDPLEKCTVTIQ